MRFLNVGHEWAQWTELYACDVTQSNPFHVEHHDIAIGQQIFAQTQIVEHAKALYAIGKHNFRWICIRQSIHQHFVAFGRFLRHRNHFTKSKRMKNGISFFGFNSFAVWCRSLTTNRTLAECSAWVDHDCRTVRAMRHEWSSIFPRHFWRRPYPSSKRARRERHDSLSMVENGVVLESWKFINQINGLISNDNYMYIIFCKCVGDSIQISTIIAIHTRTCHR